MELSKKVKNNNNANDTFAANHVHYLNEKQMNWQPSDNGIKELLVGKEAYEEIVNKEKSYYKKQFGYKDGNTLYINIEKEFPYPDMDDVNATLVGFMTATHELLDSTGILVIQENKKLVIELLKDVDVKKIFYIVYLASVALDK